MLVRFRILFILVLIMLSFPVIFSVGMDLKEFKHKCPATLINLSRSADKNPLEGKDRDEIVAMEQKGEIQFLYWLIRFETSKDYSGLCDALWHLKFAVKKGYGPAEPYIKCIEETLEPLKVDGNLPSDVEKFEEVKAGLWEVFKSLHKQ